MINQIGTKIYYCLLTGNVIKIIGDIQGYVKETSFDEDIEIYTELKERDRETIGLLQFEYGEYPKLSKNSTGVMVNLETKELIFSYEELPTPPQEPTEIELMQEKISILEAENEKLKVEQEQQNEEILVNMLANTEMFEMILGMMPMTLSIEDKNTKNNGGNSMIEVDDAGNERQLGAGKVRDAHVDGNGGLDAGNQQHGDGNALEGDGDDGQNRQDGPDVDVLEVHIRDLDQVLGHGTLTGDNALRVCSLDEVVHLGQLVVDGIGAGLVGAVGQDQLEIGRASCRERV